MVTPQTNTTLEEIAEKLLKHSTFCVCGHVNPDGDCLGSTLGLTWALRHLGKTATPLLANDATIDATMSFLPLSSDAMSADDYVSTDPAPVDVFICVDVPNEDRIGKAATQVKARARLSVTIDHHAVPERMSDLSYTDPDITSTTMLIWELAKHLGIDIERDDVSELATCIYTGLSTDSGSFLNQNTTSETFDCAAELLRCGADLTYISNRLYQQRSLASVKLDGICAKNIEFIECSDGKAAAMSYITKQDMIDLGASDEDAEHTVNLIRSIKGVDVVCMLKQRDHSIRGSFRAKDDTDVAHLANLFGGGGHKAAAGFTLECSMEEALDKVRKCIKENL